MDFLSHLKHLKKQKPLAKYMSDIYIGYWISDENKNPWEMRNERVKFYKYLSLPPRESIYDVA